MARTERMRQAITGEINQNELNQFKSQGWRAVAVEWERDLPSEPPEMIANITETPFGLRVAKDCSTLEENPDETNILLEMMELIIQDGPYPVIADVLNRKGYRTREGNEWSAVSVFEMLPRLIEAAPQIFTAPEWERRKEESRHSLIGRR